MEAHLNQFNRYLERRLSDSSIAARWKGGNY
jgi:hypothetical protein